MSKRWDDWPRGLRWLIGIATVALVLAIAWALFVPVADWLATHDVGSVTGPLRTMRLQTARDTARGRLLTLGAGLFAAGALVYTARNYGLSREGQVTDRYTKAIEQLGSDRLDVRIGGIYALERIARDSARDHPTVMEVLSAFVREHSREPWPQLPGVDQSGAVPLALRDTRPDVQAAVTVIGHRNPRHDLQPVNLLGADLTRANLTSANLTAATLHYANLHHANLRHANLRHANLREAILTSANLGHANLTSANLTLANLGRADLTSANLTSANLTLAMFSGTNLTGANFTGANLTYAIWPPDAVVPDGWQRDTDSGRLKRADTDSGDSATT